MKAMAPLLLAAGLSLAGGCATTNSAVAPGAQNGVDYQKVYLVEQWARRNNVAVVWINYPRKTASATQ